MPYAYTKVLDASNTVISANKTSNHSFIPIDTNNTDYQILQTYLTNQGITINDLSPFNNVSAPPVPNYIVYVSPMGLNSTDIDGSYGAGYADPSYAMTQITYATTSLLVSINLSPGIYSVTNFAIKPSVSMIGYPETDISVTNPTTLHSSWAGTSGAQAFFTSTIIASIWNLDFTSLGSNAGAAVLNFHNNRFFGDQTYTGQSGQSQIVNIHGNEFYNSALTLKSISGISFSNSYENTVTIETGASGGASTLVSVGDYFQSNVVCKSIGSDTTVATIIGSQIVGTLTVDGIHVTVNIDAVSVPLGGFVYLNGASSSQVNKTTVIDAISGLTAALAGKLSLSGGTMTGAINMGSHQINNMTDPSSAQDAATKNYIDTKFFTAANTVWADLSGNNANSGQENAPFADPFAASNAQTGSVANPKLVIFNSGAYSTTTFNLKPNVSLQGSRNSPLTVTNPIGLDSSWSSAAAGSINYLVGCNFVNGLSLDYSTQPIGGLTTLWMMDCVVGDTSSFIAKTGHKPTIKMNNCRITNMIFESIVVVAQELESVSSLTIQPSSGGGGTNVTIINSYLSSAISITGSSGSSSTVTIQACSSLGALTIDSTFVTLTIDESSMPSGGITYTGGATSSQVTVLRGDMGSSNPFSLTAGKILRADGSKYTPTTATFADTYSASNLLYSNGANAVTGLATANSAQLVTNSSGVPAMTASMTNGQVVIGSTSGTPSPATLTAGSGISVTNGAASITVATSGVPLLASNNSFTAQNRITPVAITSSSGSTAWDLNSAPNATYSATENSNLAAATNQVAGTYYNLVFVQNNSAAKTFTFDSSYKFPGGVVPIVSTGLSAVDMFTFRSNGTTMYCVGIAQNIS